MNLLFGQHTRYLGSLFSDCVPSHTVMSLLESSVSGYDRIHSRKAVVNGDTLFHSRFSCTVDKFVSANIVLVEKGDLEMSSTPV